MTLSLVSFSLFFGILTAIPAGPVSLMIISSVIQKGFKAGLPFLWALLIGEAFYLGILLTGLDSFIFSYSWIKTLLLLLGGLLLCYVGVTTFKSQKKEEKISGKSSFYKALLITLTNPAILFIFVVFFSKAREEFSESVVEQYKWWLAFWVEIGCASWFLFLMFLLQFLPPQKREKFCLGVQKIAGIGIFLFGLSTLWNASF